MGDGPPPTGGGMGPTKWWGPCSSSELHGPHQMVGAHAAQVGSASCSWVMGPHQLVGASGLASMRQEGYEARGGNNYLFLNCLIDNDFTSCVAWTTKWSKFQPITTSLFSFSENVLKLSYSNAEFKQFSRGNTPVPPFWWKRREERGSLFLFSENVLKLSYNNAELTIFSGDYTTRPPF